MEHLAELFFFLSPGLSSLLIPALFSFDYGNQFIGAFSCIFFYSLFVCWDSTMTMLSASNFPLLVGSTTNTSPEKK
jgi:hypothetical protein